MTAPSDDRMSVSEVDKPWFIRLAAGAASSRRVLHRYLVRRGFSREDEFYYLPNLSAEAWQSVALAIVRVFYSSENALGPDAEYQGSWDAVEFEYILCGLPEECIGPFVSECRAICEQFGLRAPADLGDEEIRMRSAAGAIARDYFAVGTEDLAILVEEERQRWAARHR